MTPVKSPLGLFLKARRARLDPVTFGFDQGRRRLSGLRREEVAQRAGISAKWYTFLEQGRGGPPSAEVLERLSRALALTGTERKHLFDLARPDQGTREKQDVPPTLQHLLDAMELIPAFIKTPTWDIVAWNRAGSLILTDYASLPDERRNLLHLLFGDPKAHTAMADWEQHARFVVGALRLESTKNGWRAAVEAIAEELSQASPQFAALWNDHEVGEHGAGTKRINHPVEGPITLEYASLGVEGHPGLGLVVFTPASAGDMAKVRSLIGNRTNKS